jgi:hypothetical protein
MPLTKRFSETLFERDNVPNQDPDESEAADKRGSGADEERGQTIRDCLLQEQSPVLAVRVRSVFTRMNKYVRYLSAHL